MKTLTLTSEIDIQAREAADGKAKRPTFTINAYTGGALRVGAFYRPVVLDLRGLRSSQTIPILLDHDPTQIVGQASAVSISRDGVALRGTITGDDEPAAKVISHAKNGFRWQASVGVSVEKMESVGEGTTVKVNGKQFTGPLVIARRGRLGEVSFVAIGADEEASASVAARRASGVNPMPRSRSKSKAKAAVIDDPEPRDPQDLNASEGFDGDEPAPDAEETRLAEIDTLTAGYEADGFLAGLRRDAIRGEVSIGALRRLALDHLRASRPSGITGVQGTGRSRGVGNHRDVLAAAVMLHAGMSDLAQKAFGADACQRADDLRAGSLFDICAAALHLEGHHASGGRESVIKAAFSTVSMPYALNTAVDKTLSSAYMEAPASWRSWVGTRNVKNFRQHYGVRPYANNSALEEVGKDGELKHASLQEEVLQHQAQTRGKIVTVTRQDIVNDDLQWLTEIPAEFARQSARSLADLVYSKLMGNAGSFFGTANGNYLEGADTALSVDALQLAVKSFRERVGPDGRPIDVGPATLIVPPALEFTARSILNSSMLDRTASSLDNAPTGNPLAGLNLKLEVETRLGNSAFHTNASDLAWYLAAAPTNIPGVVVSYLNNRATPTIESAPPAFHLLGLSWRIFFDFGVDLFDPRGILLLLGEAE